MKVLGRDTGPAERLWEALGHVVSRMSVGAKMDLVGALDNAAPFDDLAGDLQEAVIAVAKRAGLK